MNHKTSESVANEIGLNMRTKNRSYIKWLAASVSGLRRSHQSRILARSMFGLCHHALLAFLLVSLHAPLHADDRPDSRATEAPEPTEAVMLSGDWVPQDPHRIDYAKLPRVPSEHVVVSDVRAKKGVNQHNYLAFHEGRFFAMWSDGPGVEDRVGQRIRFATSDDGLAWSEPKFLTPEPPGSGPGSPHYATRSAEGMRWISRGFWQREGELLALGSLDEAAGFFGPSLQLRAFRWTGAGWEDAGQIADNAINNFPPKKISTGDWMMSRRRHDYKKSGVEFLVGGVTSTSDWDSVPVLGTSDALSAEEPLWWALPDDRLVALFRDNRRSKFLFRSVSEDQGRTWSVPVRTNFPDATSKLFGLRLSDGRYVLISNSNPRARDPLTLAISDDGIVFDRLAWLVGGRHVDYPHAIEQDGRLFVAFAGGKQTVEVLKIELSDLDKITMPASVELDPIASATQTREPRVDKRSSNQAQVASTTPATTVSADRPGSPDVVVYGATPAGIAAALAASESGREVWLIEPTGRIGGMVTHGLSHSDFHSFEALHGPFLDFSHRVRKHYETIYGKDSEQVRDSWRGTHGEPSVNLLVFEQMIAEKPTIRVITDHRLDEVTTNEQAITAVTFSRRGGGSLTAQPKMVIDATYEGDLLAAAGVPYRVGREARSEYGESLAPDEADAQVQGYNFRLCMTQDPDNRVPVPVPENYGREDYAELVRLVEAGKFRAAFGYPGSPFVLKAHLPRMPNGKHDINDVSKGLVRLSMPGRNQAYPEGDLATRKRIEQEHLDWQLGLIRFVQTDPELPAAFRKEAATWGLCRDEFADTGHIPPQIYVREARRMVGQKVYTETDTQYAPNDARSRLHRDSIAVGEYSHNCHGTDHEGPMIGGKHTGEFYKGVAPYQIPYGVLVPKKLRNLIVPTACSASHVGFCALRLEPIWMSLGGAAGHAAAIACDDKISVQQVDVETLQRKIWSRGGATIHVSDVPPDDPDFIAVQWWGGLGGLHHLEPAPAKPGARGKHIASQYFEAFPGHAAKLEQPLDDDLIERWSEIAIENGVPVPEVATNRGEWIRAAWNASKPNTQHRVEPTREERK